jgi:hypothetical protein
MLLWIFQTLASNYATLREYLFGVDVAGSGGDLMWSIVPPVASRDPKILTLGRRVLVRGLNLESPRYEPGIHPLDLFKFDGSLFEIIKMRLHDVNVTSLNVQSVYPDSRSLATAYPNCSLYICSDLFAY